LKQKTRSSQTGVFKIEKVATKDTNEPGTRMPEDADAEMMQFASRVISNSEV
jgi:hypothetical protein